MPVNMLDKLFKHRGVIWLLFIVNVLGTIYGYIWYGNQLEYTAQNYPAWLLPFVPDSPTASLFFTIALLLLLYPPKGLKGTLVRELIEALAVVTSVKYGIWAVGVIFAGGYQGDTVSWKDWMLVVSHTGMAVEALIYARFFSFRRMLPVALLWTLANDMVDYSAGVYPWLPSVLEDDVTQVQNLTILLTLLSAAAAWAVGPKARRHETLQRTGIRR
ncbi:MULTISPECIES: DUF1405 domain-containing protein [unclassified Paenibacillus]|uniref:DUF1405 domain-containing protein n=1 Tax=unclassified Paenibacillus TaxID=185978 RepID=UPI002406D56F|nr:MULTISPECIES: DUF1405 domain-containing protein [unclassified Paenibacillus]MDF9840297.1 putative membrane protein YpjA [Paenibacillus sp. PastF-2]MDF9846879.1 putative membrane protein YpjA [Paenibacillus sp. PastM-2]MDF9853451.1 putative membrane protein YpjA [Paenibacillus sp. PastF-1]MDH6479062.1 putative membrane protein YpjA [Paenibacillus sp. PastH-2]MDH6506794.1 putative membrane protein YpjA [Paenibacillus sp. PastM-3]